MSAGDETARGAEWLAAHCEAPHEHVHLRESGTCT